MKYDFRSREADHFRRRRPVRETQRSFLIVTEGKRTEPNYIDALCERFGLRATRLVDVEPSGADPKTLISRAKGLKEQREKESEKSNYLTPYDEIWAVFDWEAPNGPQVKKAREAIQMSNANGIKCADSNPAFEFWLLLHYEDSRRPFENCDKIIDLLKKYWPTYKKADAIPAGLLDNLTEAIKRAKRCRKYHEDCNGDGNPSTNMHLLIESLLKPILASKNSSK